MSKEVVILMGTAATLGFVHTLFGPDHYLPFVAMAKARRWSMLKTFVITSLCGIGHVASSVVLGFLGLALGIVVYKLEAVESFRGNLAAWFLIAFGFTYFVWGLHRAIRRKPHTHTHRHQDGEDHEHRHSHVHQHAHVHETKDTKNITPWILFTIFVFGPCEPLIPLLMYPAAEASIASVAAIALVFGITTLATMLTIVMGLSFGISKLPLGKIERFSHALAGLTILLCGSAIQFLGL